MAQLVPGISGLRYCDAVRAQKIQAGPWLRLGFRVDDF